MAETCKDEFHFKHFGCVECKPEVFYQSQWGARRGAYLVYRSIIFVYVFVWFVVHVAHTSMGLDYWYYLTNWAEFLMNVYFLVSLSVSLHGYLLQRGTLVVNDSIHLQWYHKLVWILFNATVDVVILVDVLFWAVVSHTLPTWFVQHPLTIHLHVVNFVLIFIDILVTSFPVRLLHFIYGSLFGAVYVFFTLVLYWTGGRYDLYSMLDWKNSPGIAATTSACGGFFAVIFAHVMLFSLVKLRSIVVRWKNKDSCRNSQDSNSKSTDSNKEENLMREMELADSET